MATARIIYKNLITVEDLALGKAPITQSRGGTDYALNKLTLVAPVEDLTELGNLDTDKWLYAILDGTYYAWSGVAWVASSIEALRLQTAVATIAAGVITATVSRQNVDTEGAAATDDLDTVNLASIPDVLYLFPNDAARTVVIKHATGNLVTTTAADIALDTLDKGVMLVKANTVWLVFPLF